MKVPDPHTQATPRRAAPPERARWTSPDFLTRQAEWAEHTRQRARLHATVAQMRARGIVTGLESADGESGMAYRLRLVNENITGTPVALLNDLTPAELGAAVDAIAAHYLGQGDES